MTFGNWFCPFRRRQVLAAPMTRLKTISFAVSCERAPLVRTVLWRTVANTLSIGCVTGMSFVGASIDYGSAFDVGSDHRDRGAWSTEGGQAVDVRWAVSSC